MRGMEHLQSGGLCQGRENWGQGVKRLEGDSKRVMGVIGKRIYTGKVKKKSVPFMTHVGKPLLLLPTSLDIYSLILHRRLLNVTNVGRPLLIPHILLYILELTLERSLLSVMCVGKHLPLLHILSYTNELTLERNHMNVRNVEKPFLTFQAFLTI